MAQDNPKSRSRIKGAVGSKKKSLAPQKSKKKLTVRPTGALASKQKTKKKAPLPKKGPLKKVRRKLGKPVRFFKRLFKGKDKKDK